MTPDARRGSGLDRRDTAVLKGIGIVMIAMHNFLHRVRSTPGENEFNFDPDRFRSFLDGMVGHPESAIRVASSYLGPFGVQLFIFLSAYGLAKSFSRARPSFAAYVRRRFDRVYVPFVLGIALWAACTGLPRGWTGPFEVVFENAYPLALKLALVSNLVHGQFLEVVGPWWFVPFIFQFYLVFPLLLDLRVWGGDRSLVIVSAAGLALAYVIADVADLKVDVFATVLPHLPQFCLGIILGTRESIRLPGWLVAAAAVAFALGNVNAVAWYASHVSALVLMLAGWERFGPFVGRAKPLSAVWAFFGGISMQLFLVHGFLRWPFLPWARASGSEFVTLGWAAVSITVAVFAALFLREFERALRAGLRRITGLREPG